MKIFLIFALLFLLRAQSAVIVDTDMGLDDVTAVSLLLSSELGSQVKGITTVQGIADVDKGTQNILKILTRINRTDIPVAQGLRHPISGNREFPLIWRNISDTLPYVSLPTASISPVNMSAPQFLVEMAMNNPGIDLVCLGPLTNIAKAIEYGGPSFVNNIGKVVVMGGAVFVPGNAPGGSPAECNLWIDPTAAMSAIGLGVFTRVVMIPLDVTDSSLVSLLVQTVSGVTAGNEAGQVVVDVIHSAQQVKYTLLHDPAAMAAYIQSQVAQYKSLDIEVVVQGDDNPVSGQTVVAAAGAPIQVGVALQTQEYSNMIQQIVSRK
eukprot:TRINITY_DN14427_c0_g1_i3.p1 TRINITY_DN14427_c0_g1~~TRINITY_DN14427_c0_g1_i3.p1  ORF type:complete len:343 (-),score=74.59 TRINITY_DN14427_c0_g1_i3:135-1100(-)